MKIEVWTDIICPWCGIGHARLKNALSQLDYADQLDVEYRSYQLDPRKPHGETQTSREMLKTSKGWSDDQITQMTSHIERLAAEEGLQPYIVAENQIGNTSLAHELAAWATEQGKSEEIWSLLFKAYFGEKRSIFDVDSLVALAGEIGLDETEAREALESRRYAEKVRDDAMEMQRLGGNGVPFVVVDRKYGIPGAQPLETFIETIDAAWKERSPLTVVTSSESDGAVCGPEGCE